MKSQFIQIFFCSCFQLFKEIKRIPLFYIFIIFCSSHAQTHYQEEILGQPFSNRYPDIPSYYARNIWDMKAYNGKLYLGEGNSSNKGPSTNSGPVPIIYYEPVSMLFVEEGRVEDEQIDRFIMLHDSLYIPGHDPMQNWELGNIYKLLDDGASREWKKFRNIPDAVHTYDLASFGNLFFAASGTLDGGIISESDDNGKTWKNIYYSKTRVYTFLKVKNRLFATTGSQSYNIENKEFAIELNNNYYKNRPDLQPHIFFPGKSLKTGGKVKITNAIYFDTKSAYIGAYQHNDHQMRPFGFYVASSLDEGEVTIDAISLPEGFEPWDTIVKDSNIFLLTNKLSPDRNQAQVFYATTESPTKLYSLFSFNVYEGFIRSFEEMDGYFYLSVGSEIDDPKNFSLSEITSKTGTLLRVKSLIPQRLNNAEQANR